MSNSRESQSIPWETSSGTRKISVSPLIDKDAAERADGVWQQFTENCHYDWKLVYKILEKPEVNPEYHRRAIRYIFDSEAMFSAYWVYHPPSDRDIRYLKEEAYWMHNLTSDQAAYTTEILPEYGEKTRQTLMKNIQDDDMATALYMYNYIIIPLLSKLPKDKAETLFADYSIEDPNPAPYKTKSNKYDPLIQLMLARDLDEDWKRKGVQRMHKLILEEEKSGKIVDWPEGGAYERYTNILPFLFDEDGPTISREFHVEELKFMLSIKAGETPIAPRYHTRHVNYLYDLFDENESKHAFARAYTLRRPDGSPNFYVGRDESVALANRFMADFPEDLELKDVLEQEIKSHLAREKKDKENKIERERRLKEAMTPLTLDPNQHSPN